MVAWWACTGRATGKGHVMGHVMWEGRAGNLHGGVVGWLAARAHVAGATSRGPTQTCALEHPGLACACSDGPGMGCAVVVKIPVLQVCLCGCKCVKSGHGLGMLAGAPHSVLAMVARVPMLHVGAKCSMAYVAWWPK